jgi:HEAT repeat protein
MGLVRKKEKTAAKGELRFRDRSKEDLLDQLRDPQAGERRWAARDLGEYADAMPALCDCLETEPDTTVRAAILTSLLKQRSPEIASRLCSLLRSEDAALHAMVLDVLANMPDQLVLVVDPLLHDDDPDLRILAVTVVSRLAHPTVPALLLDVAERDAHPNVVAAALEGLGECGTTEMIGRVKAVAARFPGNAYLSFTVSAVAGLMGHRLC